MLLEEDVEKNVRNIAEFCSVSDETKSELRAAWDRSNGDGRPIPACACCGLRDLNMLYDRMCVSDLPERFQLNEMKRAEFEALKEGVRLMDATGKLSSTPTDLSVIMSTYLARNGLRYHLHSELVNAEELFDVCIGCILFIRHESEPVGKDENEEDRNRRKRRSEKLAKTSQSIAAGYDLGVLSRVSGLVTASPLELALLSPNRSYMVTVKVSNPNEKHGAKTKVANQNGLHGAKSLRGDCIVFTHDGPAESIKLLGNIGENVKERIQWVVGGRMFRVVLVGDVGQAETWLHDNAVLVARPHVIFNQLRIRHKIDQVLNPGLNCEPGPDDSTYEEDFVHPLDKLGETVFKNARILDEDAAGIDAVAQAKANDVADVRDTKINGLIASVGLMSSSSEPSDDADGSLFLTAVRNMLAAGDADGGQVRFPVDSESSVFVDDEVVGSVKQYVSSEGGDRETSSRHERVGESFLRRSSEPICEFTDNGLNIMKLFRDVFPLMRIGAEGSLYGPLKAKGKLSVKEQQHLFLQFSNVAASHPVMHHFLANQTRRHSVVISTSVRSENVAKFEKLVNNPGFNEKLAHAIAYPGKPESKKLHRKISMLLVQAGKDKPWGCAERANVKPILLALKDRHGLPSMFLTVALDDVHNVITVRLTFPTKCTSGFPSFTEDENDEQVETMMQALRNGGQLDVGAGSSETLSEGLLQRKVADNPVAAAHAYHNVVRSICKILLCSDDSSKRTVPIFEQRDGQLCRTQEAELKGRANGIVGQELAHAGVTEVSGRKALHLHMMIWTAASPEFLAKQAASEETWKEIAKALSTQVRGDVGLEVHVLNGLQQVLKVKPPRATFTRALSGFKCRHEIDQGSNANEKVDEVSKVDVMVDNDASDVEDDSTKAHSSDHTNDRHAVRRDAKLVQEGLAAVRVNNHGHFWFTCHNDFSGRYGCRYCKPAGHPVNQLALVQLNMPDRVPDGAVLCGDYGDPVWCDQIAKGQCSSQWPGVDDSDESKRGGKYLPVVLTKPTPQPAFPSGNSTVSSTRL